MTIVSHIGLILRDENLRRDLRGRSWPMLMKKDCELYTLAFGHFVDNLDFPRSAVSERYHRYRRLARQWLTRSRTIGSQ